MEGINNYMKSVHGTILNMDENPIVNRNSASVEEATFTQPGKGFTITGYARIYIYDNNAYLVVADDSGKPAFESFANSFTWTGHVVTPSSDTASQQSSLFTSSQYDFKIQYPGKPTTTTFSFQSACDASPFSSTMYSDSIDSGDEVYTIYATSWPTHDVNFANLSQSALKSTLVTFVNQDMLTNTDKLISTQEVHIFSGKTLAIDAQFLIPGKTPTYGFDRVFTIGNVQYDLFVQNAYQSDFDNFANSFQFTGTGKIATNTKASGKVNTACINPVASNVQHDTSNVQTGQFSSPTYPDNALGIDNTPSDDYVTNDPNATIQVQNQ